MIFTKPIASFHISWFCCGMFLWSQLCLGTLLVWFFPSPFFFGIDSLLALFIILFFLAQYLANVQVQFKKVRYRKNDSNRFPVWSWKLVCWILSLMADQCLLYSFQFLFAQHYVCSGCCRLSWFWCLGVHVQAIYGNQKKYMFGFWWWLDLFLCYCFWRCTVLLRRIRKTRDPPLFCGRQLRNHHQVKRPICVATAFYYNSNFDRHLQMDDLPWLCLQAQNIDYID